MKKYFLSLAIMAIFAIGFTASDDSDSSSSKENNESTKVQEPKKNPLENFVGSYTMYDDNGNAEEDGVFVTDDGRLFYKQLDGSGVYCGSIHVLSDNVFEILLAKDFYAFDGGKVWSYKNGKNWQHEKSRIDYMTTLVFDISEKKMYVNKSDYDNRDYSSPEYYKFRFKKKSKVVL